MAAKPVTSIFNKKKLNRADYMFADKTGEELIKNPGQINGLDFQINKLTDCTVYLLDTMAQVSIHLSQYVYLLCCRSRLTTARTPLSTLGLSRARYS